MTTKTRRFMVSFTLDVPEEEIITWFEDLWWCEVENLTVEEIEYKEKESCGNTMIH